MSMEPKDNGPTLSFLTYVWPKHLSRNYNLVEFRFR